MKEVVLKSLAIKNFRGIKDMKLDLAGKTIVISGRNGAGKTSTREAYNWLLYDKSSNGKSLLDIRPHGSEEDIEVEATFSVDNSEFSFKKIQTMQMVKDRDTGEKVFKGNKNAFFVNGMAKSQKEFDGIFEETICKKETFLFCSNSGSFFGLDTKKKREVLEKMAGTISNEDIFSKNPQFNEGFKNSFRAGTAEKMIKMYNYNIKKYESKRDVTIPAEIKAKQSQIDFDIAEKELYRAELQRRISEALEKENRVDELSNAIMQKHFEINEYSRNANTATYIEKEKMCAELDQLEIEISKVDENLDSLRSRLSVVTKKIDYSVSKIESYEKAIKDLELKQMDESMNVCPTCGREFDESKKAEIEKAFNEDKTSKIEENTKVLNFEKAELRSLYEELKSKDARQTELRETKIELTDKRNALDIEHQKLIFEKDFSNDEKYKALNDELSALESEKDKIAIEDCNYLRSELAEVEYELKSVPKVQREIESLENERRMLSQSRANAKMQIDLLNQFQNIKHKMLEESVNKLFKSVKWQLFEKQINGEYKDCCYAIVDGVAYEKSLNDSNCLLANIEILQTFQKQNGISIPLWLDRAESIDENRPFGNDCQLIILRRVLDDFKLEVLE